MDTNVDAGNNLTRTFDESVVNTPVSVEDYQGVEEDLNFVASVLNEQERTELRSRMVKALGHCSWCLVASGANPQVCTPEKGCEVWDKVEEVLLVVEEYFAAHIGWGKAAEFLPKTNVD